MKKRRIIKAAISLLLTGIVAVNLTGCTTQVQAADLMEGVSAAAVSGKAADDSFIRSQMRLSVELFQSSVLESKDKNVLISPLSVQLALAMTANGAAGKTREEMEQVLGGEIPIGELNEYLYSYVQSLPSEDKYKLEIANSIWFRDQKERLTVEKDFLQKNADYYGAQAYKSPFDNQTVNDINSWVKNHTDGMIDKIIEEIGSDTVMYLINALVFDAEWENIYDKSAILDGTFTAISGDKRTVEMMSSKENSYLDDGKATGFIKDYKGGKYSFAALLPNEGVDIYEYMAGLTGEGLLSTLENAQSGTVMATLPKFSYEYELRMNDVLAGLGMPSAFDGGAADFSKMAKSANGNIYIGDVLHKTFISVDERGTKAGAVTKVEMVDESIPCYEKVVVLDRPFVYMLIDNATNLPLFIGAAMDIEK